MERAETLRFSLCAFPELLTEEGWKQPLVSGADGRRGRAAEAVTSLPKLPCGCLGGKSRADTPELQRLLLSSSPPLSPCLVKPPRGSSPCLLRTGNLMSPSHTHTTQTHTCTHMPLHTCSPPLRKQQGCPLRYVITFGAPRTAQES